MPKSTSRAVTWLSRALLLALLAGAGPLAHALCAHALSRAAGWRRSSGTWQGLPLELAVPALAAVVLTGCVAWLLLVTAALAAEALTGRSGAMLSRVTPAALRRLVSVGLGVTVTGAAAIGPASAVPDPCGAAQACITSVSGLPVPDRAAGLVLTGGAPPQRTPARARPAPGSHVVEEGDSLWRIAASRLSSTATPAEVDGAWRRLYQLNQDRIGGDPDLLRIGLQLRVPRLLPTPRDKDES